MEITTSQQRNAVSACCCPLPESPEPRMKCWQLVGTVKSFGFYPSSETPWMIYKTFRQTRTYDPGPPLTEGPSCVPPHDTVTYETLSGEGTAWCQLAYSENFIGEGWLILSSGTCPGPFTEPPQVPSGYIESSAEQKEWSCDETYGYYLGGQTNSVGSFVGGEAIPDTDPVEYYPPCTFKDTNTVTVYDSGGGSLATTTTENTFPLSGTMPGVPGGSWSHPIENSWLDGMNYSAWLAHVQAAMTETFKNLIATRDFDECPYGLEEGYCDEMPEPGFTADPEPDTSDIIAEVTYRASAFYGFCVPAEILSASPARTYYEVQWDWVQDCDGYVSLLESKAWVWDGNPLNTCSPRYPYPEPSPGCTIRIVNLMSRCWRSNRIGSVPTLHGESLILP